MQDILVKTDCKRNRYVSQEIITYKDVIVPMSYTSDGLTKKVNKYQPRGMRGALVHDYCAETGIIPWVKAAKYAREIWKEDGVSAWARNRWYWAIRTYGVVARRK